MRMKLLRLFYLTAGLVALANGVWMLAAPHSWYTDFPAAIPELGPLNAHFVRDLGVMFTVSALGFGWSAFNLSRCRPVHLGITAFLVGHALVHVAEMVTGHMPAHRWWVDLPFVFLPAAAMLLLALPWPWRDAETCV